MADNFSYTPGSGETGAADDIDGVKYPRVKVIIGANNTNDGDVSSANPLPVTGTVTANLSSTDNTVLDNIDTNTDTLAVVGAGAAATAQRVHLADESLSALENITVTSSGTVTANAGTNLNTSALALEAGGNLAAIKAKTDNIPALGQALAAASVPVILPAATVTTLTPPAAITGFATETTVGGIKTGTDKIPAQGQGLMAASLPVAIASNQSSIPVAATLQAGSAAIGKLAANSGVDIGDVDVASIAAGTNAIGKLLPPDIDVTAHTNYARKYYTNAGAVTDGIVWSPAAGKRWHVTSLIFQVSADATVTFEDDKAGGDDPILKGEFKAGSGLALSFDEKYPFASGEDAADLTVTTSAGNIYITVVGFEI